MKKFLCLMLCLMMMAVVSAVSADSVQEIIYALANEPDGIDPGVTNNSFASPFSMDLDSTSPPYLLRCPRHR